MATRAEVSLRSLQDVRGRIAEALFQLDSLPEEVKTIRLHVRLTRTVAATRRKLKAGSMVPVRGAIDALRFALSKLDEELAQAEEE